ncbi:hypothetical protein Hypma_009848 [Hypsizygus marmoreus]|uniref:Uncharacterized protein n=1 Tax=Hypsizygus marmoreus TaxID=39966 RepID=A0A369JT96_HYPMA|nr:hypothetical protein Hypma_009848 [Hypsizygus marmoreus]
MPRVVKDTSTSSHVNSQQSTLRAPRRFGPQASGLRSRRHLSPLCWTPKAVTAHVHESRTGSLSSPFGTLHGEENSDVDAVFECSSSPLFTDSSDNDTVPTQPTTPTTPTPTSFQHSESGRRTIQREGAEIFHLSTHSMPNLLSPIGITSQVSNSNSEHTVPERKAKKFTPVKLNANIEITLFRPYVSTLTEYDQYREIDAVGKGGLSKEDFCAVFSQCCDCLHLMTRNTSKWHKCRGEQGTDEVELSAGDLFILLDSLDDVSGITIPQFQRIFTQCRECH